jgi:hypothetical protein
MNLRLGGLEGDKKAARHVMTGGSIFNCLSGFHRGGDHVFENDLHGHRVAATLMGKEELAIAVKLAVLKPDLMTIVITVERKVKFGEAETVRPLSVALGLFSLADHSIVHTSVSFQI